MKKVFFVFLWALSVFAFSQQLTTLSQQEVGKTKENPVVHPTKVTIGQFLGETQPIRDIQPLTLEELREIMEEKEDYERNEELKERFYPNAANALPKGPDPVWQRAIWPFRQQYRRR